MRLLCGYCGLLWLLLCCPSHHPSANLCVTVASPPRLPGPSPGLAYQSPGLWYHWLYNPFSWNPDRHWFDSSKFQKDCGSFSKCSFSINIIFKIYFVFSGRCQYYFRMESDRWISFFTPEKELQYEKYECPFGKRFLVGSFFSFGSLEMSFPNIL